MLHGEWVQLRGPGVQPSQGVCRFGGEKDGLSLTVVDIEMCGLPQPDADAADLVGHVARIRALVFGQLRHLGVLRGDPQAPPIEQGVEQALLRSVRQVRQPQAALRD